MLFFISELMLLLLLFMFFFFKHKTAYDMRISDWSSDVCSSDLGTGRPGGKACFRRQAVRPPLARSGDDQRSAAGGRACGQKGRSAERRRSIDLRQIGRRD